jgi:lipopolysaccharide biosynthesis glycosyltransferase
MKNAVVLACDNSYMDKLETTIKSICAHNKNIKFYILNEDLPIEWFRLMTKKLSYFNSEILNIKVSGDSFKKFRCPSEHINYQAYFRYLIPDYVSEEKVLYLDCDIIVTESLDGLFNLDLKNYPVAAVPDLPTTNDGFNSGVLLINNKYWKENDILNRLIKLTVEYHEKVYGDQGILNILFKDKWYRLSLTYNLQVGSDSQENLIGNIGWYDLFDGIPKVIHYTYTHKPWFMHNMIRFKDIWWFYYSMSWDEIILDKTKLYKDFKNLTDDTKYETAIYTNSVHLHEIERLIKNLSNVHFNILAHTYFGNEIISFEKYMNVSLYPCFNPLKNDEVLNKIDFYLDINYQNEVDQIIEKVHKIGKPVYSFESTNHDHSGLNNIYKDDDVESVIKDINKYLKQL